MGDALKRDAAFFQTAVDDRRGTRLTTACIDRQTKNGARVLLNLGLSLCAQRHQTRIVRARADFREPDLVTLDE